MGVPLPPSPPPPPQVLVPPPKTLSLSFWVLLVEGVVLFGLAVFAYTLTFRLLLSEWGSLSRREKIVNAAFFVSVALLVLLAFVGFVIALSKEANVIWK
jgi:succinate dehydrogenase/fumarate reductase cytochrome b subunit